MDANPEKNPGVWTLTVGRLLSGFALVSCVPVGVLFVSVATGALGIVLGITGYALGARTLGPLAVVLCTGNHVPRPARRAGRDPGRRLRSCGGRLVP